MPCINVTPNGSTFQLVAAFSAAMLFAVKTLGILCLLAISILTSAAAPDLRVGVAAVKITPPEGAPLAGYYYERKATAVHDDLYAKTLILEAGGDQVALVSLDLIHTKRDFVEKARELIQKETGLPPDRVMISATHAHTGPVLSGGSARIDALGGTNSLARDYSASLPQLIARSVSEARNKLTPAVIGAGNGHVTELSFNRRYHMRNGAVGWNPGKMNTNIIKAAGPIDPEFPVLFFESPSSNALAAYLNFAIHLDTVGGTEISADAPGTAATLLANVYGTNFFTLYTTGSCGDINHLDVGWPRRQGGHGEAARIGTILAAEALKTIRKLQPVTPGPLQVKSVIVQLPLPAINENELAEARKITALRSDEKKPDFLDTVKAFKVLDVAARAGKPQEVEVQVICLGAEIAWVALPGEIFIELGQAIKRASPFKHTIIVELANGSVGYVPTRRAYAEGNYEPISARCAAGSGEILAETAIGLLQELWRAHPPR